MSNPDALYPSSNAEISPTHHDALATYEGPNANLVQSNKAAVFATLVAADITQVVVNFDGYGDEGQIGEIEARSGDHIVELPDTIVELTFPRWGQSDPTPHLLPLHKAIEHLAYHYLGQTHDGWQDGEGAYGEFVFDVAAGSITLDHNERFVDYETYSHVF